MATTTKADLRKELLIRRNALDNSQRLKHSSLIRQRIFQHPAWKNAETLLCYVSFGSEVETHMLIQEALRFKKKVIVPLHDPANHSTLLSRARAFQRLGTQSPRRPAGQTGMPSPRRADARATGAHSRNCF